MLLNHEYPDCLESLNGFVVEGTIFDRIQRDRLLDITQSDLKTTDESEKLLLFFKLLKSTSEMFYVGFGLTNIQRQVSILIYHHETMFYLLSYLFYDPLNRENSTGNLIFTEELNKARIKIFRKFKNIYKTYNEKDVIYELYKLKETYDFFPTMYNHEDSDNWYGLFCEFYINTTLIHFYLHLNDDRYNFSLMRAMELYGKYSNAINNYAQDKVSKENIKVQNNPSKVLSKKALKDIVLPLAIKIWNLDSDTNLLMRIQVAELIVELLPDYNLTTTQVNNWLKQGVTLPPGILDRYNRCDYGNTKEEREDREKLISFIKLTLSRKSK